MKRLLLACAITLVGFSATASISSAAGMSESHYCKSNGYDPLCMSPKMLKMRMAMMKMTKSRVMENRSKYCREQSKYSDPICTTEMMHSTMGF
jgi:hypothetical protein